MKKSTTLKQKSTLSRRAFLGGVGVAAMAMPVTALAANSSFKKPTNASSYGAGSGKCPNGFVRLLIKKPGPGQKLSITYIDSKQY